MAAASLGLGRSSFAVHNRSWLRTKLAHTKSLINSKAKVERWGKSFILLLTFVPRAFNVHERFWRT